MHLRMPTEKAHGLQIAKTLEAMTLRGEMVELWVPARKNIITEDIFTYYSLTAHFPVRAITSFAALRFVRVLGSIAYWLDALAFLVALAMERIETESVYYTRSAPVAWLLAQKGAHVYFEAHLWPNTKEKVFRALLRGVSLVVANSDGTREMFRKNGFVNTVVIRNGADLEKFALSISHHDARKKLNLNLDENIIMYVGSFARWKGVATLYAAWVKIQKQFPDTRLVFVGGEKNTLAQFDACGDIDQNDRVTVLPHQQAALVPTYLRAANVLVLPNEAISEESIRYTSPIKLFEYMASGRPIIVSDLPAMHEVLDDTTSTFFEAGNSDDLAIKLSYALTHGAEGESRAKMASVNAEEFSWQKRAQQLSSMVKN